MKKPLWNRRLGRNVRKFRLKKGLTIEKAADKYGCARRTWSDYEAGVNMELATMVRIAKALGIKPSRLLD